MSPTPFKFESIETLPLRTVGTLPSSFQITSKPIFFKALLIRLLSGTTDIRCNRTSKTIRQRDNYSALGRVRNSRVSKKIISDIISPVSINEYDVYLKKTNSNNWNFYRELYTEYSAYFFQKQGNNEVVAFLHLYRILERIAYCFPLLWAARSKDYEKTFDKLKSYFNDPKIGELGVFKRFISEFIDSASRDILTTLNIHSVYPDWQKRYYEVLFSILNGPKALDSYREYSQIVFKFDLIIDMMIKIRNRYFHALTGHSNSFTGEQIVDAQEFFAIINESLAIWLSYLTFQIIEFEIKQF